MPTARVPCKKVSLFSVGIVAMWHVTFSLTSVEMILQDSFYHLPMTKNSFKFASNPSNFILCYTPSNIIKKFGCDAAVIG